MSHLRRNLRWKGAKGRMHRAQVTDILDFPIYVLCAANGPWVRMQRGSKHRHWFNAVTFSGCYCPAGLEVVMC